jgi:omega-hydroxy-beta-dihydromenaquinone-9 sulfotransferase
MAKRLQILLGTSFTNWLKVLIENRGVDSKYIKSSIYISLITFLGIPFRLIERVKFGKLIESTKIDQPPIFILGHWRSGTTYLNDLMLQDNNFAYLSVLQASAPESFFTYGNKNKIILDEMLPKKRPFDNVDLSANSPQEEEFALANLSPHSFYHGLSFPKRMNTYFKKYVLFEKNNIQAKRKWKKVYIHLLKMISLAFPGKRLLLKNPPNTARIKVLLEMFPDAKFIHIYRNPYVVYPSTKRLYIKSLPLSNLQTITEATLEENILDFYKEMMCKFFEEQSLIPPSNFVEVRYENLESNPLSELNKIYTHLGLGNFDQLESNFKQYIDSQADYVKNVHHLSKEDRDKVYCHWKFTIDKWGYESPKAS